MKRPLKVGYRGKARSLCALVVLVRCLTVGTVHSLTNGTSVPTVPTVRRCPL